MTAPSRRRFLGAIAALVQDHAEVIELISRNPVTRVIGEDGTEQITGIRHYWRVFQRNIPAYGDGSY